MISLEQVRALEARVEKAVAYIASLRSENASLKDGLLEAELRTEAAEARTAELEDLIKEFQKDQERIEEGIVQALRKLDSFEDVVQAASRPAPVPAKTADSASSVAQAPATNKLVEPAPSSSQEEPGVETAEQPVNPVTEPGDGSEPGLEQSDGLDIF